MNKAMEACVKLNKENVRLLNTSDKFRKMGRKSDADKYANEAEGVYKALMILRNTFDISHDGLIKAMVDTDGGESL